MNPYTLHILSIIILALIQNAAMAQCRLNGYIRETAGVSIPYCTVSLLDENRAVIAGTVSDTAGRYELAIQPTTKRDFAENPEKSRQNYNYLSTE